jgi:competence protein ComEC
MSGCAGWAVLVSSEPARDACRGTAPVIDRFTVWRDGAQAVWLGPAGATILSDRATRGTRPWVPPVPEPRRRTTNLPVAEKERLGPVPAANTDEAAPPADPGP